MPTNTTASPTRRRVTLAAGSLALLLSLGGLFWWAVQPRDPDNLIRRSVTLKSPNDPAVPAAGNGSDRALCALYRTGPKRLRLRPLPPAAPSRAEAEALQYLLIIPDPTVHPGRQAAPPSPSRLVIEGNGVSSPSRRFYVWHSVWESALRPEASWPRWLQAMMGDADLRAGKTRGTRESLWLLPGDFLSARYEQVPHSFRCPVVLLGHTSLRVLPAAALQDPATDRIRDLRWDGGERSVTYRLDGQWYRLALPAQPFGQP